MPPSEFYISRTREKRFKDNTAPWICALAATVVGFALLVALAL